MAETCQWLYGDGPFTDADKCAKATVPGSSFCERHTEAAYVASERTERLPGQRGRATAERRS